MISVRKIVSLTLLISLVLCILTSLILYIVPHGRVAYWADWRLWGLSKTQWSALHLNLGVLLLVAAGFHLYYNWKPITAYLKNKAKHIRVFTLNFNIALLIAVLFTLGTLFEVPPMSTIVNFSEAIKDAASRKYGEPPYGHAELSSLKMLTRKEGLDLERSIDLLKQAGIRFQSSQQTIEAIAEENHLIPKNVYDMIKPAKIVSRTADGSALPDAPPPGFGRRTLDQVCTEFNLGMSDILHVFSEKGIAAEPAQTIKEIAAGNRMEPMAIFEIVKESVDLRKRTR